MDENVSAPRRLVGMSSNCVVVCTSETFKRPLLPDLEVEHFLTGA